MSEVQTICQLGHPVLRQIAQPVEDLGDPVVQNLIDRLIATVQAANGVGIAAPQVGQCDRLLIIASRPNARYPNAPEMPPTAMINPQFIAKSAEMTVGWEGCLSIPGIRGLVPRHTEIEVEYTRRNGQIQRQILTDFVARIFQHEFDHLNGLVFLDRVESSHHLLSEVEYQKQILQKS